MEKVPRKYKTKRKEAELAGPAAGRGSGLTRGKRKKAVEQMDSHIVVANNPFDDDQPSMAQLSSQVGPIIHANHQLHPHQLQPHPAMIQPSRPLPTSGHMPLNNQHQQQNHHHHQQLHQAPPPHPRQHLMGYHQQEPQPLPPPPMHPMHQGPPMVPPPHHMHSPAPPHHMHSPAPPPYQGAPMAPQQPPQMHLNNQQQQQPHHMMYSSPPPQPQPAPPPPPPQPPQQAQQMMPNPHRMMSSPHLQQQVPTPPLHMMQGNNNFSNTNIINNCSNQLQTLGASNSPKPAYFQPYARGPSPPGPVLHPMESPAVANLGPPANQDSMVYCVECRQPIYLSDVRIVCRAGCDAFYHRRCSGLTELACELLLSESAAEWACYRCLHSDREIPLVRINKQQDCRLKLVGQI